MKKTKTILLGIFLLLAIPMLHSQSSNPFAEMILLEHDSGNGGSVEFVLVGNPNEYSYYWAHGAEELYLTGLAPGTYTLVVQNFFGCVQEFEITIESVNGCTLAYTINDGIEPCTRIIVLEMIQNGVPIDESELNITWSDNNPSGMTRIVNTTVGSSFCVIVSAAGYGPLCRGLEQCFTIDAEVNCGIYECDLEMEVTDGREPCTDIITVALRKNGIPIDESLLDIRWSDGANFGLVRPVSNAFDSRYCVLVSTKSEKDGCPVKEDCVVILMEKGCGRGDGTGKLSDGSENSKADSRNENALLRLNALNVFPNPFWDNIQVNFQSIQAGEVQLSVYSVAGQELFDQVITCEAGENNYVLKGESVFPSGLLLLELTFPSGEKMVRSIVRMDDR